MRARLAFEQDRDQKSATAKRIALDQSTPPLGRVSAGGRVSGREIEAGLAFYKDVLIFTFGLFG